ncbi:MAG: hypothetical protein HS126_10805 [Anaerolineales bacterium]|nr:hypothetical protein [Anaerolineales bacterium]
MPDLLELLPSQETPCYEWDFGDGSMETTTVPTVTHDYSYALDTDHVTRQFHVRCRIVHNNFEVIRTLLIHSAYVLCKRHGTIVPPIDVFPEIVENMFGTSSATMIVQNVEDTPLTITHEALVLLSNDPDALETPPSFVELGDPLILKPKSVTELAIIGPAAKVGFTVYYAGHAQDGTPVRFSATFDWTPISSSEGEQGWLPPIYTEDTEASWSPSSSPPWEIITEYFWDIISRPPDPDISITADDFFLDKKTGTLAITIATGINQPLKRERLEQAHNVMLTGLMPEKYLMSKVEHAPAVIDSLLSRLSYRPYPSRPRHALLHPAPPSPPEPGPVSEGQYCDPDNISDEDEAEAYDKQLVCQLVDEEKEYLIPGRFLNARKGDIVLSPGGAGLIGSLLRTVSPPQRYSHCGIMTRNYDEITHSTASEDRLRDYKTGTLEGSDGIRPDVVKYLWPGVVTQSVEAATHGESWVDPENGNTQSISSFAPHAVGATHNDFFEIVPPLVVKPDPLLETPAIRERLHGVATEARAVGARPDRPGQSHYRLYCYTDPRIGLTTVAGPEAGWAQDTFPSVCSSFIWMMLKKCGVHLETDTEFVMPQDLETSDLTQGAEVRPGTLDGLYTYAAQERMAAAEWLYNYVYYLAYDQAGWCGNFLTDAAPQAANEVTNTFVIDQPFKDWPFWQQSIGPADAVSPDNILLWDSPEAKGLYGYVEPLQYREPRTVKYKLSRWKKVLTRGEVTGTVRISEKVPADEAGKPVAGAFVEVYDGKSTYTDDNGFFTLSEVPAGWYDIKANKVVDGIYYSTRTAIKVAPPVFTVDLKLKPPAETFRLLQIYYEFYGVDEEIFDNEVTHAGPASNELELGPDRLTNSMPLGPFKWGGECQAKFGINAALLWDGSIEVNVQGWLYEGTDEETEDLDGTSLITLIVPRSETIFGVCTVSNTAEDCGDIAQLSITVKNNKNTN